MKQNYEEYDFSKTESLKYQLQSVRCAGLAVLPELVADASDHTSCCPVYEAEKERTDSKAETQSELSVQRRSECIKCSCTGRIFC